MRYFFIMIGLMCTAYASEKQVSVVGLGINSRRITEQEIISLVEKGTMKEVSSDTIEITLKNKKISEIDESEYICKRYKQKLTVKKYWYSVNTVDCSFTEEKSTSGYWINYKNHVIKRPGRDKKEKTCAFTMPITFWETVINKKNENKS